MSNIPPNPYIAGNVIRDARMFFGRDDVLVDIQNVLSREEGSIIVISGQRRIGKTSILQQLEMRLPDPPYCVVGFDLMHRSQMRMGEVLHGLAKKIGIDLHIPEPILADYDDAGAHFQHVFLPIAYKALGKRKLVLLFDEFDTLDVSIQQSLLPNAAAGCFFSYLDTLMKQETRIGFVFAIGRKADELNSAALGLFKAALAMRISVLSYESTRALILTAQREGTLGIPEAVVARIYELSSGHPLLTQLLCQLLFNRAYFEWTENIKVPELSVDDVDTLIPKALEAGAQFFAWIWDGLPPAEKVVFATIAQGTQEQTLLTDQQLTEVMNSSGIRMRIGALDDAPHKLIEWGYLRETQGGYKFLVELLRRWVVSTQPLSKVKNELDGINPRADMQYQLAVTYVDSDDLDESLDLLKKALRDNPNHMKARRLLGEVYRKRGNYDDMVSEYARAFEGDPERVRNEYVSALLLRADWHADNNQSLDALHDLDEALALAPTNKTARTQRTLIYMAHGDDALKRGELDDALAAFEAIEAFERIENTPVLITRSAIKRLTKQVQNDINEKRWRQALPNIQHLIDLDPKNPLLRADVDLVRNQLLADYHRKCIERWSSERYRVDRNFVRLVVLYDDERRGWMTPEGANEYDDLRVMLSQTPDSAIILLGPPGSGKTTLLRRLQFDEARDRLHDNGDGVTFFIALSRYHGDIAPRDWLSEQWRYENPELPDFEVLLASGRMLLLLDALNEMRHANTGEYANHVSAWRDFLQVLVQRGNRAVFTCRSLDYSTSLSSPDVPVSQVSIRPMAVEQIKDFLHHYLPEPGHAERVYELLRKDERLIDLYRTPYFLSLLAEQVLVDGSIPMDRAELLTRFIRNALRREVLNRTPSVIDAGLLNDRDLSQISNSQWQDHLLPERGLLIPKLTVLAFEIQQRVLAQGSALTRLAVEEVYSLLDDPRANMIVDAGVALGILDEDLSTGELRFQHRLLQEYFAARQFARQPQPEMLRQEWRSERVVPSLDEILAKLGDRDQLPMLANTDWEETAHMAAAMARDADQFVIAVMQVNLALAGSIAAATDVRISTEFKDELRKALINRSQDPSADLRARIATGLAIGSLGDPRFERRTGPNGDYLLPPLTMIPGGTYTLGDDESEYDDERPAHSVTSSPFQIGTFPVTNAEYQCFMAAGGYEYEQWWDTGAAKRWLDGETSEGPKQSLRDLRNLWQTMSDADLRQLFELRSTSEQIETMLELKRMSDDEFEAHLENWYPSGIVWRQPKFWSDSAFNNPTQPVVGICLHEAHAYCCWLSAQTELTFRLPTEVEREIAIRGNDSRSYAYGNMFSPLSGNTFESRIRRSTPVGIYPNGVSLLGVHDLSGNVRDWTSSAYLPYPYKTTAEDPNSLPEGDRVQRGGSWDSALSNARGAYRHHANPQSREDSCGFRVVLLQG